MSLSDKDREKIPKKDFGVPGKNKYPLDTEAHIKSAAHLINHGHITSDEKEALARKILRKANEKNMNTSGWNAVKKIAEQVPPMSDGTSLGNAPPRLMAPYYDEQDELLQRANSLDPNSKETMFDKAKRIVTMIHNKTEQDSKPPTGNQNCQLCTWCAEAQFRGMNVLPRPVYSPRDPALAVKGENIVLRPIRRSFTSQRDVVETVRGAVDSRWYVHVNWAESTGGHEFLVVNLNDYAYIMDAQAGLLQEIDETDTSHNYFRDINFRNSYMVRLDDREFNTKLFSEMNDMSKLVPWNPESDVPYMKERGMLGDMSNKWTMRPATKADLEFVYFSELETVGENKNDPKVQKYIREDAKESLGHTQIIIAENSDIGVYQAYATDYYGLREGKKDWWYLAHIYIKPEYRTLGIGSAIIKRDIAEHDKILLQVMKSNPRAKKLYESLGFVVTQENDHGGLIMRLDKTKPIQESFMDNLKTIGSVVKKGVNDFIFPDESNKELKLEPYTGDVPYQLYAVTKNGTVTQSTPLFKTKRYALINYSRKKVENEVMSDTGLKRVNLRFEKGSDLYIPSTINCITYVDYDERNDLIADNDYVDIDGYCTLISQNVQQ